MALFDALHARRPHDRRRDARARHRDARTPNHHVPRRQDRGRHHQQRANSLSMRSLLLLIPVAMLAACEQAPEVAAAAVYEAAEVETRSIQVTVDAAGVVEPESTVEVKSKASGEVLPSTPRPATSSKPAACSSRSTSARRAIGCPRPKPRSSRRRPGGKIAANADGASRLPVQVADADAGRLRADAARVRERRVASRQHQRGRRERAHHARRHRRASADHGHDHREDRRARHRDHVADAERRQRRHGAHEDGRPDLRAGAHARRRNRHRQDPARHAHARDRGRVSEPTVRGRGARRSSRRRSSSRTSRCSPCSSRSPIAAAC